MAVMPFLMARTPVRRGVVFARRRRAAAGPVVGAGMPEVTWLKRLGLARGERVDQPYLTPRVVVRGRRDGAAEGAGRTVVGRLRRREDGWCSCRQQRAGSRGAIVSVSRARLMGGIGLVIALGVVQLPGGGGRGGGVDGEVEVVVVLSWIEI